VRNDEITCSKPAFENSTFSKMLPSPSGQISVHNFLTRLKQFGGGVISAACSVAFASNFHPYNG
jgi:hypothetical protein